jgi:ATP-dependent Clp protease protease subunit|tara:strand:+ start:201 stop:818 length:618 start_codon:yes stop_codon:yes gene_type:complete
MINVNKKEKKKKEEEEAEANPLEELLGLPPREVRTIALFGDVDEEKSLDLIIGMLSLTEFSKHEAPYDPMRFYISTYGGSADEMFSIYDMMNIVKKDCEIETIGLGKVMSAGTLLLAAGTKGKRKIGKHCRVMIHAVAAGSAGELHNIENEVKSIKHIQELYINALAKETCMTKRTIQKLLDRRVNVYLTAEEAIEYGIADEIVK